MSDIFHVLIIVGFGALKATRKALYIKLPLILSLKQVHLNLWGEKHLYTVYSQSFDDDNNKVCFLNIAVFILYSTLFVLKIQVKPA